MTPSTLHLPATRDRIVDEVYAAAIDSSRWEHALELTRQSLQAQYALLFNSDAANGRVHHAHTTGLPKSVIDSYDAHYGAMDVRMPRALRLAPGLALSESDLIESRDYRRSTIYNEYLRPLDIPHLLAGFAHRTGTLGVILSFNRSAAVGEYSRAERDFLSWLMPHFRRATLIAARLSEARQQSLFSLETWDRLNFGICLIGVDGRVRDMNAIARRLTNGGYGLWLEGREIRVLDPDKNRKLQRQLCLPVQRLDERDPWVLRTGPLCGERSLSLYVVPAAPAESGLSLNAFHRVLLMFAPGAQEAPDPRTLREMYPLTPVESEIAAQLVAGMPLQRIASYRRLSPHTVRTHVKRILEKSGAFSQAEFIRQVLTSPALFLRQRDPADRTEAAEE